MRNFNLRLRWLGVVLLLGGLWLPLTVGASGMLPVTSPASTLGQPAADFSLNNLNGQPLTMSQFREGKPVILFFWATWCPHCRVQLGDLNQLTATFARQGIKLLLVNVGENPAVVKAYVKQHPVNFEVLVDADATINDHYVIPGFPTFYFIDRQGVVRGVEHYLPQNYASLLNPQP